MGKVTVPKGFDPKFEKHWYLVANRTEAMIYEGNLDGTFHFLRRFKNPKGKLTELQLVADKPGRSFSSSRSGSRHAFEPPTPYHEVVATSFAGRLAKVLDKAALGREFSDLVIMAEPHFLGMINKLTSKRVKELVRREVRREWAQGSDKDLKEFLRAKLSLSA